MPVAGNTRQLSANSSTRIRPSQNGGVLPKSNVNDMLARSKIENERAAANMPTKKPIQSAKIRLAKASIAVLTKRGSTISLTARLDAIEVPKSP